MLYLGVFASLFLYVDVGCVEEPTAQAGWTLGNKVQSEVPSPRMISRKRL